MPLSSQLKKVLVIGSGPIVIGQAAEFDYAGTQACLALKEEGIEVVLVNNNPATIMTDPAIADQVYMEPLNVETIEAIIAEERPDGMIGSLGGQTGLNLTVELYEKGILERYGVELLGTSVESIQKGEDREKFRNLMLEIDEPISESKIISSVEEGMEFGEEIGLPVIIRPAYTLGGEGGGFAYDFESLESILKNGLKLSPIHQVLVEKSIKGWKEVEYEVMRDANDTCVIVCNMENFDPVGVHTGDSIVVAPSQTLSDRQYHMLRDASLKVIRALDIVGGCNIQFALDPNSENYCIIEVNPRVSRSSALASKATGYPIARMAAKCAVGYHLDELLNPITGNTYASFEPALDYIVVKLPRFPFDKFPEAERVLGTQMKATGEVMAIDRTFSGALNKAIRSLEQNVFGLRLSKLEKASYETLLEHMNQATDLRLYAIAEAMWQGVSVDDIHATTQIDPWFLTEIEALVRFEEELAQYNWLTVSQQLLKKAKRMNMSDRLIAQLFNVSEKTIRSKWKALGWKPGYKLVDTCAAEFEAVTPYYYSTWQGADEVEPTGQQKIAVIGSGPIRIGQGIEFDYCSVHAAEAIQKHGFEAVVINNNPETVSTDYSIADRLYFEPLTTEDILNVLEKENVKGVLIQFGGQTAINLAESLQETGVKILGTSVDAVEALEDREYFYDLLKSVDIPHIQGKSVTMPEGLEEAADELGFPVIVRPSYVTGGQSMYIFHSEQELKLHVERLKLNEDPRIWPLLVDQYIPGLECEVDVISDGKDIIVPGIFEHIEKAGVHSGDSVTVFPPLTLDEATQKTLIEYAGRIARKLPIVGMMNIQFVISGETIFVLEVNPRASRTVPIMSKVTGIPMVEWATSVQLGTPLSELHPETGLLEEPGFYAVKAPVFSASKLKGVDHVLGPEMKSTGEVLGLGATPKEAFAKVVKIASGKTVLCSVTDREKADSLPYIEALERNGFEILATVGTAEFLTGKGKSAEVVHKEKAALEQLWKDREISAVLNIPTNGRNDQTVGFHLRELATRYQTPCFTSLDTIGKIIELLQVTSVPMQVCSIGDHQRREKVYT